MCLCMYVSMYVMFCHLLYVLQVYCMYIYIYIYIYVYIYLYVYLYVYIYIYVYFTQMYICMRVYIYVYSSVLLSMYVLVHIFACIKVICLSSRYLGCYLSVWHCYMSSKLAFSFEIVQLNTTTGTKSSTRVIKINQGNMNSLFPTIIINNSGCLYLFIQIKF